MRYHLTAAAVIALASVAPSASRAQTPVLPPPKSTPLQLPLELVKTSVTNLHYGSMYFERVGLTPREFRVGSSPQMTDAVWAPFKATNMGTKLVGGRTVSFGTVSFVPASPTTPYANCLSGTAWVRAWMQLRASDPTGKQYVSNVKGDSACMMLGG